MKPPPNRALQRTRSLVAVKSLGAGSGSAVQPRSGGRSPLNAVALGVTKVNVLSSLR